MLIEDAVIITTRFSKGLPVTEQELREALPIVLRYAEMAMAHEDDDDTN